MESSCLALPQTWPLGVFITRLGEDDQTYFCASSGKWEKYIDFGGWGVRPESRLLCYYTAELGFSCLRRGSQRESWWKLPVCSLSWSPDCLLHLLPTHTEGPPNVAPGPEFANPRLLSLMEENQFGRLPHLLCPIHGGNVCEPWIFWEPQHRAE